MRKVRFQITQRVTSMDNEKTRRLFLSACISFLLASIVALVIVLLFFQDDISFLSTIVNNEAVINSENSAHVTPVIQVPQNQTTHEYSAPRDSCNVLFSSRRVFYGACVEWGACRN